MSLLTRVLSAWKQVRTSGRSPAARLTTLFAAPPPTRPAGWWRDDHVEQLRNYHGWVYAAVNAIAQEVARQRPFLYLSTGQADHEQGPLPHTHPLVPAARPSQPVAHAVGTVVPHRRLSRTDRQLLLVRRAAIARRVPPRYARRTVGRADAVGAGRSRTPRIREGLRGARARRATESVQPRRRSFT